MPSEWPLKPCRRCGGPKPRGRRRQLCDECREVARVERAGRHIPLPCRRCGGMKPRRRGVRYCDECRRLAEAERRRRERLRVPVDPLREAFQRSGMTPSELARALGWEMEHCGRRTPQPDTTRVQRRLGIKADNRFVNRATAEAIVEAMGYAPVDFGF